VIGLKSSQLLGLLCGACAITATLYLAVQHPRLKETKKDTKLPTPQVAQASPKVQKINLELRNKTRHLFELPETHEATALKTLIHANKAIESYSSGDPAAKSRVAAAQAEIQVLQKRSKALGVQIPDNLSENLQLAQAELTDLSQLSGAKVSSQNSLLKIVTTKDAENRVISSRSIAPQDSSIAPPSILSAKATTLQAVAAAPTRSTLTCTDANPADPNPNSALTATDLYTTQSSRIQDLATRLQTPQAIFQFVQQSVRFSGSFGAGQTADQVLISGSGTSADKASLMIALLRARGIPAAYMVGELQLTEAQMKSLLGVTSSNDLFWALWNILSRYYGLASATFTMDSIAHSVNGTTIYNFPEVWVRAYINGTWVDLDPVNLNNNYIVQNESQWANGLTVSSITPWFFSPDSEGRYVKPGTYADVIVQAENTFLQNLGGAGANVRDVGAVFVGQTGGLASQTLPTTVPGNAPCRELSALNLPSQYQFTSQVQAFTSTQTLMNVSIPTASMRSGTLYFSHSAGTLQNIVGTNGFLQLRLDNQILSQSALSPTASYNFAYKLNFPSRYFNGLVMDRTSRPVAYDVQVINQMVDQVPESEVIAQYEKIMNLMSTSQVSNQRLMAEMLRLAALEAIERAGRINQVLGELRGVSANIVHSFTTGTVIGLLQDRNDRPLGKIPLGANIDWPMVLVEYPRIGNHSSYSDYLNVTRYNAELNASSSSLESDIWNELFGVQSMSTILILQTAAEQVANGSNNQLIGPFILNSLTKNLLISMLDSTMAAGWTPTIQSLVAFQPAVFTTRSKISLSSGWSGSAMFVYPTNPSAPASSLIITNTFPILDSSVPSSPLASQQDPTNNNADSSSSNNSNSSSGGRFGGPNAGGVNSSPPTDPVIPTSGTAQNSPTNPTSPSGGCPVSMSTGAMWHQLVDFEVKGRVPATDLILTRTYLSFPEDASASGFGPNWVHNWETHLTQGSGFVAWMDEAGGVWRFTALADGIHFSAPPGQFASLSKLSDRFELRKKDGVVLTFALNGPEPFGRLRSITDPHGEQALLSYNSQGLLASVSAPFAGRILFTYAAGHITQILREREGFNYTYQYDSHGRLVSSKDFANRVYQYAYNSGQVGTKANGLLSALIDPLGRQIGFTYYDDGRAFTQTEPGGAKRSFMFSPYKGDIHSYMAQPDGSVTEYVFDDQYRHVKTIFDDGAIQAFSWSAQNQIVKAIDELGYATQYQYDSRGNRISQLLPANTVPTTFSYDPNFNKITRIAPPVGSAMNFTIDSNTGDVLGIQRNLSSRSIAMTYTRDQFGNPLSVTSNLGQYSDVRDGNGFLTRSFDSRNPVTFNYDQRGRVIQMNYQSGRQIAITYNDFDNVMSVADNSGPRINFTYDLMQRVVKKVLVSGSSSQVNQYNWDDRDRLVSVIDPMGNQTQYLYEKTFIGCHIRDLPTVVIDPKGQKTQFLYDNQQRLTQKTEPNGSVTQFSYSPRGDLIAVSDPNGHRTKYRFDGNRRLISEVSNVAAASSGGALEKISLTSYQYDMAGRLVKKSVGLSDGTAPSSVQYFSYDELDRLTNRKEQTEQNGVALEVQDNVSMSYEDLLAPVLLKQVANVSALDLFTHESLPPYNVTSFSVQRSNPQDTSILEGTWSVTPAINEPFGLIAGQDIDMSLGFAYDPAGRATSIQGRMGKKQLVLNTAYDGFGRKLLMTSSDGLNRSYSYDAANRLVSLNSQKGISEALSYDANSLITELRTSHGIENFLYDPRGQLTSAMVTRNNQGSKSQSLRSFGYDPTGNRVSDNVLGSLTYLDDQILSLSSLGTQYLPDPNGQGQLTQAVNASQTESFKYGVNGKVLHYERNFGCQNGTCNRSVVADYAYDGLGRRLSKQIVTTDLREDEPSVQHIVQSFVYLADRDELLLSRRIGVDNDDDEGDDEGNPGRRMSLYILNQGSASRLGEALGEVGAQPRSYELDHLGSVLNSAAALSNNEAKNAITLTGYGPFGESNQDEISGHSLAVVFGFAGGEYDLESHRYYFRARVYDPAVGRWASKDPIGFGGGDTNLYAYCGNDPLNCLDPRGLWYLGVSGGATASVGFGVGAGSYEYGTYIGYSSNGAVVDQYSSGTKGIGLNVGGGVGGVANLNIGWGDSPEGASYGLSISIPVFGTATGTISSGGISIGYSNGPGWQLGITGVKSDTGLGANAQPPIKVEPCP